MLLQNSDMKVNVGNMGVGYGNQIFCNEGAGGTGGAFEGGGGQKALRDG